MVLRQDLVCYILHAPLRGNEVLATFFVQMVTLFFHQITSILFLFTVTNTCAFTVLRSPFSLVALAKAGILEARSDVLFPACTSSGNQSFLHLHCVGGHSILSSDYLHRLHLHCPLNLCSSPSTGSKCLALPGIRRS